MTCELYANIGIGHENDLDLLKQRVVTAASCNADAVVINKSSPHLVVPEHKKYVPIPSKWGTMAYFDVAKKSELSAANAKQLSKFCEQIGIPVIWSVTDSVAAEFVKEHCAAQVVKLHFDSVDAFELSNFCASNFKQVIYCHTHLEHALRLHKKRFIEYKIYYTTQEFPPEVQNLQLHNLDKLVQLNYNVGYESREAGIFPALATVYKGIKYIEKYLGDDDSDNASVLTPAQFYDLFNSMQLLEHAHHNQTQ